MFSKNIFIYVEKIINHCIVWFSQLATRPTVINEKYSFSKRNLRPGWYMLEVEKSVTISSIELIISITGNSKNETFTLNTKLSKQSKRLFFNQKKSDIKIEIRDSGELFENINLKIKRVSKWLAYTRTYTKLQSLHPIYKYKKHRSEAKTSFFEFNSESELWLDYCKLFEDIYEKASYSDWINEFEKEIIKKYSSRLEKIKEIAPKIFISLIILIDKNNTKLVSQSIASVKKQSLSSWQLILLTENTEIQSCIVGNVGTDGKTITLIHKENATKSSIYNHALAVAKGDWTIFINQGDLLADNSLIYLTAETIKHPLARLFFTDEDTISENGIRDQPCFRSEWDEDLFYSQDRSLQITMFNTKYLLAIGGLKDTYDNGTFYELTLRYIRNISRNQIIHIPRVLYHSRRDNCVRALIEINRDNYSTSVISALNEHFSTENIAAKAVPTAKKHRVVYAIPADPPLVSLIIPTRNGVDLLCRCLDSILIKTNYSPLEIIIIDNGSDDVETLQYLEKISSNSLIRVLRDNRPFNYSALNNAAVKVARGEIIGLVNNDVEVINTDWLSEMVSHALRPGVAAVGARLWYSDDTLQHAGVVLGIHGIAGHVHRFLPRHDVGYCERASLIQSFSAVTAACLVVRKSIYEELGGLNETELQVACNDVDFCLRAREAGYKNIWTPYAELYHHESASRGFDDTPEKQARSAKEIAYMKQRWGDALLNDPAYSPNLTLDSEDFGLAWPPRVPSLDEVLSAMEQVDQASTLSSPRTLQ